MYLEHFNLNSLPFENTPDPAFFFMGANYRETLAIMLHGVASHKGMLCVAGPPGTGKTTLAAVLVSHLPKDTLIIPVTHPKTTPDELARFVAQALKLDKIPGSTLMVHDAIHDALIKHDQAKNNRVLIVDEAQFMSDELFEEILFLSNLETSQHKLIQILLLGQKELLDKINQPKMRQLKQRMFVTKSLGPMDRDQTAQYIRHRIEIAGAAPDIFSDKAIDAVYALSGGSPRVINKICDASLLSAFLMKQETVAPDEVRAAGANMGIEPDKKKSRAIPHVPARPMEWCPAMAVEMPETRDRSEHHTPPPKRTVPWLAIAVILAAILLVPGFIRNRFAQSPKIPKPVELILAPSVEIKNPEPKINANVRATAIEQEKSPVTPVPVPEAKDPSGDVQADIISPRELAAAGQQPITDTRLPYSILLATFLSRHLAQNALDQYKNMGFSPYCAKVIIKDKGPRYRIFAGRFSTRLEAESVLPDYTKGAEVRKTGYAALLGVFATEEQLKTRMDEIGDEFFSPYVVRGAGGMAYLYAGAFYTPAGVRASCAQFAKAGIPCEIARR